MNDWNVVIIECSSLATEWEQLSAYLGISICRFDWLYQKRSSQQKLGLLEWSPQAVDQAELRDKDIW